MPCHGIRKRAMDERIFVQGGEGQLDSLEKKRFSSEEELQKLLTARPELLDGEQTTLMRHGAGSWLHGAGYSPSRGGRRLVVR